MSASPTGSSQPPCTIYSLYHLSSIGIPYESLFPDAFEQGVTLKQGYWALAGSDCAPPFPPGCTV